MDFSSQDRCDRNVNGLAGTRQVLQRYTVDLHRITMASAAASGIRQSVVQTVAAATISLSQMRAGQFENLRRAIGNARVVCIGEETHGTEEFYEIRAQITKYLMEKEGFDMVICEGDFPAFYDLHRYVRGTPHSYRDVHGPGGKLAPPQRGATNVREAMRRLRARYPVWMWYNMVMQDFVSWLKSFNENLDSAGEKQNSRPAVGIFGMDIYSMRDSAREVISYLEQADPELAMHARRHYEALSNFGYEPQLYGRALLGDRVESQKKQVVDTLMKLLEEGLRLSELTGDGEEFFGAAENARVVKDAEEYYRQSFTDITSGDVTWNIRDTAMVNFIDHALAQYDKQMAKTSSTKYRSRCVVWAHNSHLGDARSYVDASSRRRQPAQINVGQLVRERYGMADSFLIGQLMHSGTVRASLHWDGKDYVMDVNPSLPSSYEQLFHQVSVETADPGFGLILRSNSDGYVLSKEEEAARNALEDPKLERFIGVQYHQDTERYSHYMRCRMPAQFDAVIHLDDSSAIRKIPTSSPTHVRRRGTVDYSEPDDIDDDDET
ncbi:hypothetical protein R1sor_004319 [Riccia sorocarpa]|uniref:Erythromycin esterase n=1 Tax=Riccia sorocarpa TaxID=122646 RepID=A0ABD3HGZ4_9MARC